MSKKKHAELPLPCPFCGSDKITVEWEPCGKMASTDTNRRWFAECTQCSCQGPFCQKEPQVIPAWNKRTESSRQELLEALKELPNLLCDVAQLLDGWHNDGTVWTEWDESVRKRVSEMQSAIGNANQLKASHD